MRNALKFLLAGAFALAPFTTGEGFGPGSYTVTAAAFLLCLAALVALVRRLVINRPAVPVVLLRCAPVIAGLAYMAAGIGITWFVPEHFHFARDAMQRVIIMLVPIYAFALGAKQLEDLEFALLSFLPIGGLISLITISTAVKIGFVKPVYILDMHKNNLGATCVITALISEAFLISRNFKGKRWIFLATFAGAFLSLVAAQSRAAMVSFVVGHLVILVCSRAKKRTVALTSVMLAASLVLVFLILPKEAVESATALTRHSSNALRVALWSETWELVKQNPLGGVGWGNLININGRLYNDVANAYLLEWAQTGLVGLLAFLSVVFFSIFQAIQNAKRIPPRSVLGCVNAAAGGIVAARFVHGFFDIFWIGRGPTLVTFMAVGMVVFVKLLVDQNELRERARRLGLIYQNAGG